mgnify:CR=1 FL=1
MKLEREILTNPAFIQPVKDAFIFAKIEFADNDADTMMHSPEGFLMQRYNVEFFPTIIVVDGNGQRLFSVDYKGGGPQTYVQELLGKLGQRRGAHS